MIYRHATNLRAPFEPVDLNLLIALTDYRIGPPVPAAHGTAYPLTKLKEEGFVGLYLSEIELATNKEVIKRTGWTNRVLGPEVYSGE